MKINSPGRRNQKLNPFFQTQLDTIEETALRAPVEGIRISLYSEFALLMNDFHLEAASSNHAFLVAHALIDSSRFLGKNNQERVLATVMGSINALFVQHPSDVIANDTVGTFLYGLIERGRADQASKFLDSLIRYNPNGSGERNQASSNVLIMKACARLMKEDTNPDAITLLVLMRSNNEKGLAGNLTLGDYLLNATNEDDVNEVLGIFNSLSVRRPHEFAKNFSIQHALEWLRDTSTNMQIVNETSRLLTSSTALIQKISHSDLGL